MMYIYPLPDTGAIQLVSEMHEFDACQLQRWCMRISTFAAGTLWRYSARAIRFRDVCICDRSMQVKLSFAPVRRIFPCSVPAMCKHDPYAFYTTEIIFSLHDFAML